MTTNVGCIAVLLGTMGVVTGAAADESNASLTEKRGLFPIVPVPYYYSSMLCGETQ